MLPREKPKKEYTPKELQKMKEELERLYLRQGLRQENSKIIKEEAKRRLELEIELGIRSPYNLEGLWAKWFGKIR